MQGVLFPDSQESGIQSARCLYMSSAIQQGSPFAEAQE